ncbi:MAG TPA: S41 family peptidase [Eubacteriaceae bacterium]|nr:S41 family peptidase [Eubacteriaceae bacterium]
MKKRLAWLFVIILLIVSNIATFLFSNTLSLAFGNKVLLTTDSPNTAINVKKLIMLKDFLQKNYYLPLEEDKLMEGSIKGMFDSIGDPYTIYMTPSEYDSFVDETEGSFGGIGIQITLDDEGFVTIIAPIEDTPGERVGLKSGDKVIKVNGEDIVNKSLSEVVAKIKGEPGTKVRLTIIREGISDYIEKDIIREIIKIKTVKSEIIDNEYGYIRISMFDRNTSKDFNNHLNSIESKGINGLIIDLRSNPGGLLNEVIKVADRILGEQIIVYTEDRNKNRKESYSDGKNKIDIPLVLLVDEGSASASEILAGAVKDSKSGTLVGTKTFGKGLVQNVEDLSDGSGIKYTSSEYFTPNGINIHGVGIEPDIRVEMPKELLERPKLELEEDLQFLKALEVLKSKITND